MELGETLPGKSGNYYENRDSEFKAEEKVKADKANFVPKLTVYYTYEELRQCPYWVQ